MMLFILLASSAFAGCGDTTRAPRLTQCTGGGFRAGMSARVVVGRAYGTSCAALCEAYLEGRPGCCVQKYTNGLCMAYVGTRKQGIYVQSGASQTQAVVCDPPTYTGHEFTQAVRETNTCPAGFEPVSSAAECQRANDALTAGVYHPIGGATHPGWSTRPSGCFLQVTGYFRLNGYVMFNNNPVGGTAETRYNSNDMKICKRSTPTHPPACPLPTDPDTTSRGCAPAGFTGNENAACLNGNTAYPTFLDAWNACDVEPECDLVMRWAHPTWHGYAYFIRRSGDRVTHDGEGFTYPCAHECPADSATPTGTGEWAMGAAGEHCDEVCSGLGKTCNAAKMTCIDSADKIRDAFAAAGHTCTSMPDARDYAGAPFFQATGACYWFGQQANTPAGVVGPQSSVCHANDQAHHTALCYCQ